MQGITLDQLAGFLGITKQAVSKYEHGKSIPSSDIIARMLNVLNIPRKYLVKDNVVFAFGCSPIFFRAMSTTTKGNIDFAEIVSRWGYEILCGLETVHKTIFPEIDSALTIPEKAMELRRQWGIGNLPVGNMTALLENRGFYIFTIDSAELNTDAYSRVINGIPIIVLNKNKGTAVRRRFSLAHELGHLILHKELSGTDFDTRTAELEVEANLFAEHFLMPVAGFRNSMMSPKLKHFIPLKREWGVSMAAMIYHSNKIGLISDQKKKSLYERMSKQGWRKTEPLDDVLEFEIPGKLHELISQQITDANSFDKFFDIVRLPADEIERLCSLPEKCLSRYYYENNSGDSLYSAYQEEHRQFTLFPEDGGTYA
jgi:Zn-dependent peptidase ImmA (M78 family)/transcriptional regulator with XRE-family HTH domain